jgi:hypothetical protein
MNRVLRHEKCSSDSHPDEQPFVQSRSAPPINDNDETVLFYNVYIPINGTDRALKIVQDQLLFRQQSNLTNETLYYTVIAPFNASYYAQLIAELPGCQPCTCLQHVDSGNEELTLTSLHEHCSSNPRNRVLYFHSKGTFTANENNDHLRNLLMPAIFSDQCNHVAATELPQCNVCSAHFSVYPIHTPGNFFVAQCSYIQKLLPPLEYQQAKESLLEQLGLLNRDQTEFDLAPPREFAILPSLVDKARDFIAKTPPSMRWKLKQVPMMGISRFAMEHWVHSHPSVQPCDVHPFWDGSYVIGTKDVLQYSPSLQLAPNNRTGRCTRSYHRWLQLSGRLLEWKLLYGPNARPPNTSWVWDYFSSQTSSNLQL